MSYHSLRTRLCTQIALHKHSPPTKNLKAVHSSCLGVKVDDIITTRWFQQHSDILIFQCSMAMLDASAEHYRTRTHTTRHYPIVGPTAWPSSTWPWPISHCLLEYYSDQSPTNMMSSTAASQNQSFSNQKLLDFKTWQYALCQICTRMVFTVFNTSTYMHIHMHMQLLSSTSFIQVCREKSQLNHACKRAVCLHGLLSYLAANQAKHTTHTSNKLQLKALRAQTSICDILQNAMTISTTSLLSVEPTICGQNQFDTVLGQTRNKTTWKWYSNGRIYIPWYEDVCSIDNMQCNAMRSSWTHCCHWAGMHG